MDGHPAAAREVLWVDVIRCESKVQQREVVPITLAADHPANLM